MSPSSAQELQERLGAHGASVLQSAEQLNGPVPDGLLVFRMSGELPASLTSLAPEVRTRLALFLEQPREPGVLAVAGSRLPAAVLIKQGAFSVDEIAVAIDKLRGPKPLGFDRYLTDATPVQRVVLNRSTERGQALESLDRFISSLTLDGRRVAQVLTIADELITNAFYHAPIDGTGRHPYTHLPRIDPVQSRPDRLVELSFANSQTRVAVAVRDLYGSLDPAYLLGHMAKAVSDPAANFKVASGSGGARLGLITALRSASQLIFNVVPEMVTEGIGLIEMGGNYREFLESGKSLHIFTLPQSAYERRAR